MNKAKEIVEKMKNWFQQLSQETRKVLLGAFVLTFFLCVIVIAQGIRISKVKKELKSVQTASRSLQEELDKLSAEKNEIASQENGKTQSEGNELPTQTPVPTEVPVITPEPKKYIVCVDAGHGGWDGGAVLWEKGEEKRIEKNDNLWLASLFRDALQEYNVEVVMTRDTDVFLELSERTDIANQVNADVLISFHRNSYNGEGEAKGVEFWIHSSRPAGAEELAQRMLDSVVQVGGMQSRGVKNGAQSGTKDDYAINRAANMTSMIAEFGFVTSPSDNSAYDRYGAEYAKAMAKTVFTWLEENSPKNKTNTDE